MHPLSYIKTFAVAFIKQNQSMGGYPEANSEHQAFLPAKRRRSLRFLMKKLAKKEAELEAIIDRDMEIEEQLYPENQLAELTPEETLNVTHEQERLQSRRQRVEGQIELLKQWISWHDNGSAEGQVQPTMLTQCVYCQQQY